MNLEPAQQQKKMHFVQTIECKQFLFTWLKMLLKLCPYLGQTSVEIKEQAIISLQGMAEFLKLICLIFGYIWMIENNNVLSSE